MDGFAPQARDDLMDPELRDCTHEAWYKTCNLSEPCPAMSSKEKVSHTVLSATALPGTWRHFNTSTLLCAWLPGMLHLYAKLVYYVSYATSSLGGACIRNAPNAEPCRHAVRRSGSTCSRMAGRGKVGALAEQSQSVLGCSSAVSHDKGRGRAKGGSRCIWKGRDC